MSTKELNLFVTIIAHCNILSVMFRYFANRYEILRLSEGWQKPVLFTRLRCPLYPVLVLSDCPPHSRQLPEANLIKPFLSKRACMYLFADLELWSFDYNLGRQGKGKRCRLFCPLKLNVTFQRLTKFELQRVKVIIHGFSLQPIVFLESSFPVFFSGNKHHNHNSHSQ